MKANCQDLRERVLRAVDSGYSRAEIVQMFGISHSKLKRYVKQRREEGRVQPNTIPGRPPKKRAHHDEVDGSTGGNRGKANPQSSSILASVKR